jgi:predicted adenylyl cyclase CyaB
MENIEIKARIDNLEEIRERVLKIKHEFPGCDYQTDTYFKTKNGRIKLRESSLSGPYLILYLRNDLSGPKSSIYQTLVVENAQEVKNLLGQMLGIHRVVKKEREIYIYENVRIHLDRVSNLGTFLEFEAVLNDQYPDREVEKKKVYWLMEILGITEEDLISTSYENLIQKIEENNK